MSNKSEEFILKEKKINEYREMRPEDYRVAKAIAHLKENDIKLRLTPFDTEVEASIIILAKRAIADYMIGELLKK